MMSRLAQACGLPFSTMTGLVGRLESKRYLRRIRVDTDRRVVYVEMTPQGERAYRARLEADMRIVIALLDALTAREQDSVVRALGKVTDALEVLWAPEWPGRGTVARPEPSGPKEETMATVPSSTVPATGESAAGRFCTKAAPCPSFRLCAHRRPGSGTPLAAVGPP